MGYSLRIFGALAVVLSLSATGFLKADLLKRRVTAIGNMIGALNTLRELIAYGNDERETLIGKCFGKGVSYGSHGVLECNDTDLNVSDRQIINEMLHSLGSGDIASENRRIELCVKRLQTQLEAARREYSDKSKVYRSLGVCAGLAFGIFII